MKFPFKIRLVVLISLFSYHGVTQNVNPEYQKYLGESGEFHYFFQYGDINGAVEPSLIKTTINPNLEFEIIESTKWQKNVYELGFFIFKNAVAEIYFNRIKSELRFNLLDTIVIYKTEYDFSQSSIVYFPKDQYFLIAVHSEAPIYLFSLKSYELTPLPLIGGNLRVHGDYIFFESTRFSDNYSDFPIDIFRAHKNDLKNPIGIVIQVVENWYPYDENIVYARTLPDIDECLNQNCQGAFYNISTGKFAIYEDYIPTDKFIQIKGDIYLLNITKDKKSFELGKVPSVPSTLSKSIEFDNTQQPLGKIFKRWNLPLKEKTLPGTFVTHCKLP